MSAMRVDELQHWSIFSLLDHTFVEQIKIACVFGNLGNEALVVTREDDVFAFGSNIGGCLGLGDQSSTLLPMKVEPLCKKLVKDFAFGSGPHVLALTEGGDVYAWGHNGYCQLGNGSTNMVLTPTPVLTALGMKKVVQVACGSHHSVALTSDGEVFGWGQNSSGQVGVGSTTNQATPRKITALAGRKVNQVACGQTSSLALLSSGEVYGWGYNGNGQLGLGNNINQLTPCRVSGLQGVFITLVVCGYAHALAVTDEGQLYAWGANSYGQLGSGTKTTMCSPTLVATDIGRIVDVGALHYAHISAALTQNFKVYMWGQCRGQSISVPTETPYMSLHDVFACYATPAVMWKPLRVESVASNHVSDSLRMAFNSESTSDLHIVVEGRKIHVHKAVLRIRCEYFRSMFQNHWEEGDSDAIEVTQFPYVVYHSFLRYLYTDQVQLPPEEALGLLELANCYCEPRLKRQCEQIIKQGISVQNAAVLYATAIKFDAKELEEFCFRFMLNHMTAVVKSEAFQQLEHQTLKDFIVQAGEHGAFKSSSDFHNERSSTAD